MVMLLLMAALCADEKQPKLNAEYIRLNSGVIRLSFEAPIVYLPSNGAAYYPNFISHSFKEFDSKEVQRERGGFYKANGKPAEIELTTTTPELHLVLVVQQQRHRVVTCPGCKSVLYDDAAERGWCVDCDPLEKAGIE